MASSGLKSSTMYVLHHPHLYGTMVLNHRIYAMLALVGLLVCSEGAVMKIQTKGSWLS